MDQSRSDSHSRCGCYWFEGELYIKNPLWRIFKHQQLLNHIIINCGCHSTASSNIALRLPSSIPVLKLQIGQLSSTNYLSHGHHRETRSISLMLIICGWSLIIDLYFWERSLIGIGTVASPHPLFPCLRYSAWMWI
jgi:hypothetical protein